MKVDFYRHNLSRSDADSIADVFDSLFLTTGKVADAVEAQLATYFAASHALVTNSWTNGALATLLALGIGRGDEVIVPAMTFVATANAVALAGARPVFVDVDPDTLLMTAQAVERAITPRTRAVIPVHLYGQMVDMEALAALCRVQAKKVWLLEDAAHCFEGTRNGKRPGAWSDAALFSFYATKNVTCAEGGAMVTNDSSLYEAVQKTRNYGLSKGAIDRFRNGSYVHWDMDVLGMKANLPDVLAAVLPRQIDGIDALLPARRGIANRYRQAFADGPLRLVAQAADCVSAEHLFAVGIPGGQRDAAIEVLNSNEIGCTINYTAVTSTKYYREEFGLRPADFPVATAWGEQTVSLPLYPSLEQASQDHVIRVVCDEVYPLVLQAASTA